MTNLILKLKLRSVLKLHGKRQG